MQRQIIRKAFVLIIDGTPEEQISIIENLEDMGYLADSVANPKRALDICEETRVDIVLSSLQSVEEFGLAAYRAIQDRVPELRFIMTVPSDRVPHLDLPGLNVAQVVPAPFLLRDLLKSVRRSLNSFSWKGLLRSLAHRRSLC